MTRSVRLFVQDIVDSIDLLEAYTQTIAESEFYNDTEKQDAIVRRIEIVGEAARNLPSELREKNSDIPWRDIVGMRNIIVHHYHGITYAMVWRVATSDLPKLKDRFIEIRDSLPE